MKFEIKLPARLYVWAFRAAGVEVEGLSDLSMKVIEGKAKLPATVKGQYHVSDPPVEVSISVLDFGKAGKVDVTTHRNGNLIVKGKPLDGSAAHMQIEIADDQAARAVKMKMEHYSVENNGERVSEEEHKTLWAEIKEILKRERISYDKFQCGKAVLTRPAMEMLMEVCEKTEPIRRHDIYGLFTEPWVPKSQRAFVAQWLIKRFEQDYNWDDQLGMRIWDNSVPAIAEDLIRLIENRKYDHHRAPLCPALAKTKHPRAADVIASVMNERWMAYCALEGLGKLPDAKKHVEGIKRLLRDSNGEIRRAAKKVLKKLGVEVEPAPPPPVHLISNKGKIPRGLEEWSANLDMDNLQPTLERLSKSIDSGFAETEIREVCGVAEEMHHDQTKVLRFGISAAGQKADLFVVLFMDDIDSPDLAIHSIPQVVHKLKALTPVDA